MAEKIEIWESALHIKLTQADIEAACTVLREHLAAKPETFKDGDAVNYVAPDGLMGPFRVQILDSGSVHLWFRQPDRPYAQHDWGHRIRAIFEKGNTLPGTRITVEKSIFTESGPDTDFNMSYLLKVTAPFP